MASHKFVLAALVVLCAVLWSRSGLALDRERSLGQFEHTAWTTKQGAPPDVWALAQSSDGYLWLGTGSGLYRFDGVKFERFKPEGDRDLPGNNITALLALPNGDLWIGYFVGGVSLLKNGRVTTFTTGIPRGSITQFAQDKDGAVWVAGYGGLSRYLNGAWKRIGPEDGFPNVSAFALAVSRDGVLWVTASAHSNGTRGAATLFFLPRGSGRFEQGRETLDMPWAFAQSPNGRLWLSDRQGVIQVLTPGQKALSARLTSPPQSRSLLRVIRMAFDRDGALWGVERGVGVFRTTHAADSASGRPINLKRDVEYFGLNDGLTSDIATSVLEDREGDIWIGTNLGLDRFRPANIIAEKSIPATAPEGYHTAPDGPRSFYVNADRVLYRFGPGEPPKRVLTSDSRIFCLAGGRDAAIWIGRENGLALYSHGRLSRVPLPVDAKSNAVNHCAEDPEGSLWISIWLGGGLFRREHGRWRAVDTPPDLAGQAPMVMAFDRNGGAWLSYHDRLLRMGGAGTHLFSARDGLDVGDIQTIVPSRQGVLIGGDLGLARFDGQRIRSLRSDRFPVLERVTGIAQTPNGETWLSGIHGVVRLDTKALDQAFDGRPSLDHQLLDFQDGLPGPAQQDSHVSTIFPAWDGRLWLLTNHGVAWIDPSHLTRNLVPPTVSITAVTGNGTARSIISHPVFPGGTSNLRIDFTALSLQIPERVQFRYMLEGVDNGWIDPGDRRQAFYTKLGPGKYQFRVIASNNDGVWNEIGSTGTFKVLPTFYQSIWFVILCAIAILCILYFIYRLRIEYVSGLIKDKLAERMRERERIARELHDTLLQSFQGLTLSFRAAAARLPAGHAARKALDHALMRAEEALVEGRERVRDLRAADVPHDLSSLFARVAERLTPDPTFKVRVLTEGRPRELHPLVLEELTRVGEEAMFNTLRHADARVFEVGVIYGADRLTVRFDDDGKGIDPALVKDGDRTGHFGIRGMRERAQRIRGEFTLSSAIGSGVEIKVTVPAKVAYAAPAPARFQFATRFMKRRK